MDIIFHSANNSPVGQRQVDGYLNATSMCQAHKKKINDWLRLESTLELIVALAEDLQTESFLKIAPLIKEGESRLSDVVSFSDFTDLVIVRRGSPATGGGTWLHPDLAIQLAQWCSSKFAIQVSRWIKEWTITGQNPIQQSQTPPPVPKPKPSYILSPSFSEIELSPEDETYQRLKELGKQELQRRFYHG